MKPPLAQASRPQTVSFFIIRFFQIFGPVMFCDLHNLLFFGVWRVFAPELRLFLSHLPLWVNIHPHPTLLQTEAVLLNNVWSFLVVLLRPWSTPIGHRRWLLSISSTCPWRATLQSNALSSSYRRLYKLWSHFWRRGSPPSLSRDSNRAAAKYSKYAHAAVCCNRRSSGSLLWSVTLKVSWEHAI